MAEDTARVMVTSVGSWVGLSLVSCLRESGEPIEIIGLNASPHDPPGDLCDRLHLTPRTADPAFEPALRDLVERERPSVILPSRDGDLHALSQIKDWAGERGATVAAASAELAGIFDDKAVTAAFAEEHGLPFARTAFSREDALALKDALGYPLIAKRAVGGEASKDVFVLTRDDELERALAAGIFVIQEFLAPEESNYEAVAETLVGTPWMSAVRDRKTVSEVVIGRDGSIVSMTANAMRSIDTVIHGVSLLDDPEVESASVAYAEALSGLGYRGAVNLQGKLLPGRGFVVFELNGRFSRAAWARARLGRNQVLDYVADCLGRPSLRQPDREIDTVETTEYPVPLPLRGR